VEDSGDGVGIGDDLEDTHAAAAFTAAGDVEREDAGEELCPGDAPGSGRGRGRRFGRVEVQRELWRRRRCGGPGDDALAQAMVAGEHTVIAGHVEAGRRDQGAEAGEELVGVHVGVGGAAAPGRLEGDTDAAAGERRDGVMGEGRAQEVAGRRGDALPWSARQPIAVDLGTRSTTVSRWQVGALLSFALVLTSACAGVRERRVGAGPLAIVYVGNFQTRLRPAYRLDGDDGPSLALYRDGTFLR
jgi:hypothetical protein